MRLRAGPSARLAAVLAPAGVPTVPSVLPARLLGSAARGRAACRGGGTGTRTTVSTVGPAAEAAPRWRPRFGFLGLWVSREGDGKPSHGAKEGSTRECGLATSEKLLLPPPPSFPAPAPLVVGW